MNIEDAPKLSMNNREALSKSDMCGCYFCLRTFKGTDITAWTDSGRTGLCSHCDVDSLLPGITDHNKLVAANKRWFCVPNN